MADDIAGFLDAIGVPRTPDEHAAVAPPVARPEDITPQDIETARRVGSRDAQGRLIVNTSPLSAAQDRMDRERAEQGARGASQGSQAQGAPIVPPAVGPGYSIHPDTGELMLHIGDKVFRPIQSQAAPTPPLPVSPENKAREDWMGDVPLGQPTTQWGPEERGFLAPLVKPPGGSRFEPGAPGIITEPIRAFNRAFANAPQGGAPDETDISQLVPDTMQAAAGATAGASFAGRPAGSLGTFVGRQWADGRAASMGRTTGKRVLDMAETMEQNGMPDDFIRRAGNEMIAKGDDPALGDFHRGDDGKWKLEVSDEGLKYNRTGPPESTVGAEAEHPALFSGLPDVKDATLRRVEGYGGSFRPGHPDYGVPSTIEIGQSSQARRYSLGHELQHEVSFHEGFARGGAPAQFRDGGEFAHLRRPGESPINAYKRLVGEWDAAVTEERLNMTAQQRRNTPVEETIRKLMHPGRGAIKPGAIVKYYERGAKAANDEKALSVGPEDDFTEAERKGYALEQRIARRNQTGAPRAQSPQQQEQLAREDALGRQADRLARDASTLVSNLKANGVPPDKIAATLKARFGVDVDPNSLSANEGWWNVAAPAPSGPHRWTSETAPIPLGTTRWTESETNLVSDLYKRGAPPVEIAKALKDHSGRELNPESLRINLYRRFGSPVRTNADLSDLWPRDVNLALAHLHGDGKSAVQIADRLSRMTGKSYSSKIVGDQIDTLRLGSRGQAWGAGAQKAWQPDALAMLTHPDNASLSARELAEKITHETGQVTSKAAVIGRLRRMREDQMRAELAEDLAKSGSISKGKTLRATALPSPITDEDRSAFWGGLY